MSICYGDTIGLGERVSPDSAMTAFEVFAAAVMDRAVPHRFAPARSQLITHHVIVVRLRIGGSAPATGKQS